MLMDFQLFWLMNSKLHIEMESDQERLFKNRFDAWQIQNLCNRTSLYPENSLLFWSIFFWFTYLIFKPFSQYHISDIFQFIKSLFYMININCGCFVWYEFLFRHTEFYFFEGFIIKETSHRIFKCISYESYDVIKSLRKILNNIR